MQFFFGVTEHLEKQVNLGVLVQLGGLGMSLRKAGIIGFFV